VVVATVGASILCVTLAVALAELDDSAIFLARVYDGRHPHTMSLRVCGGLDQVELLPEILCDTRAGSFWIWIS
jgi:hypothetical protein